MSNDYTISLDATPPREVGNGNKPGAQQKMKMIGHQGPRKTARLTIAQNTPQLLQKIIAIDVLPENLPALDPTNDNVMQRSMPIYSSFAWHAIQ